MKLSMGYSGMRERSHLGCPSGTFDLQNKRIEVLRAFLCMCDWSVCCFPSKFHHPIPLEIGEKILRGA